MSKLIAMIYTLSAKLGFFFSVEMMIERRLSELVLN
jgi:hypothetical protein